MVRQHQVAVCLVGPSVSGVGGTRRGPSYTVCDWSFKHPSDRAVEQVRGACGAGACGPAACDVEVLVAFGEERSTRRALTVAGSPAMRRSACARRSWPEGSRRGPATTHLRGGSTLVAEVQTPRPYSWMATKVTAPAPGDDLDAAFGQARAGEVVGRAVPVDGRQRRTPLTPPRGVCGDPHSHPATGCGWPRPGYPRPRPVAVEKVPAGEEGGVQFRDEDVMAQVAWLEG